MRDDAVRAAAEYVAQAWGYKSYDATPPGNKRNVMKEARGVVKAIRPIIEAAALNVAADWFASHDDVEQWPRPRVERVLRALADDMASGAAVRTEPDA